MPIYSRVAIVCVALWSAPGAWSPGYALDEKRAATPLATAPMAVAPVAPIPQPAFQNPQQALSKYIEGYRAGDTRSSLDALRYAAEGGEALARWKLGSMYAAGDGVPHDDAKAYDYFLQIVETYDDSVLNPRQRSIVASAFVAVGAYSLTGIPTSKVDRDPVRAREMFTIAATEFADPHAQYNLGRMYLDGDGVKKDARRGARWLKLAADKQHLESQAVLGQLYFNGADGVQRQRALGLMYLTLAREAAVDPRKDKWIVDLFDNASRAATDADRNATLVHLENYIKGRR